MSVKAYVSINSGWMVSWCGDFYDPYGAGGFAVIDKYHIEELVEIFDKIVSMGKQPLDAGNGYLEEKTWEVGKFTIHKFSGSNASLIINHARVLFHGDIKYLEAISLATKKAIEKSMKRHP